jgi:hypothetical protein
MRDFSSYEELYEYLTELSSAEYQAHLDAAAAFLASKQAAPFTPEHVVQILLDSMS